MSGNKLLALFFLSVIVIGLVAPFTFLKVEKDRKGIVEVTKKTRKESKTSPFKPDIKKVIEKPLHQVKLPDFSAITDVNAKKKAFFDFIRPAVVKKNNELLAVRAKLTVWLDNVLLEQQLTLIDRQELTGLAKRYRLSKDESTLFQIKELLVRIDIVPTALVLVQAANESAWGTSRFSRIGLNFFGIWCYRQGCGMIPAGRNTGAKHEVAAFKSLESAVSHYFDTLNSHNAYRAFRVIRTELRVNNQSLSPQILATGLLPYSQRGADYVVDILKMLKHNQRYLINDMEKQVVITSD